MSGETNDAFVIGSKLLSHAATAEDRPRYVRGRVTEMFPYIYEAAKKMGIRAISRWLKDEGYAISPPTISRALANPDAHWQALVRSIEPHAQLLVEGYGLPDYEFLFGPAIDDDGLGKFREGVHNAFWKRHDASGEWTAEEELRMDVSEPCEKLLSRKWFVLSEETREHCRKFFTNINHENKAQR